MHRVSRFDRWANWGFQGLSHLLNVPSGGTQVWTSVTCLGDSMFFFFFLKKQWCFTALQILRPCCILPFLKIPSCTPAPFRAISVLEKQPCDSCEQHPQESRITVRMLTTSVCTSSSQPSPTLHDCESRIRLHKALWIKQKWVLRFRLDAPFILRCNKLKGLRRCVSVCL